MNTVIVQAGEAIKIQFCDREDCVHDGEFEIHYDTAKHKDQIIIKETAGLGGNILGGANQALYIEDFSPTRK